MIQNRQRLYEAIQAKQSFLCIGLDPDVNQIPASCGTGVDGMERFCKEIVDATHDLTVAYKPNLAFFEQYGAAGWAALERIVAHIPNECMVIADAKRGDIGNTASRYAQALFEGLGADAITVTPYMGEDCVRPFTAFGAGRWTIVLVLTSNVGAQDFEFHGDPPLYERVLEKAQAWGTPDNMMFVVGATRPHHLARARALAPDHFFLVPGVGAQGGTLEDVVKAGWNPQCGLLVNSSRGILYASPDSDFAEKARLAALELQNSMERCLKATT
jgi:orotidine-5'-phosphate decarboxylase